MIVVKNLSFSYQRIRAVRDLSFQVKAGEIFALLGPNGAGKTTMVRLLNGLLVPEQGTASVMGLDPVAGGIQVRQNTGVLTETPALYERLTAWQNLRFFGLLYGMSEESIEKRTVHLLDLFGLTGRASQKVGSYSKGMRQRLALARALLHEPQLLFLDEPTSGLDPEIARQVQDLILQVNQNNGTTVLLCTHLLNEAQRLCDRMAIMAAGHAIAVGSLQELSRLAVPEKMVRITALTEIADELLSEIRAIRGVQEIVKEDSKQIKVQVRQDAVIPAVVSMLVGHHLQIFAVEPLQPSLEDVYFRLQVNNKEHQHAL